MNRHQVLTGAANSGDQCCAVGSVEGIHFTAYATGCDVVILSSDFQRVQILPGAIHGNIQVSCIDCCTDAGKIAASYGKKVLIFEPVPLAQSDSSHKLDYQWYHTGTIELESDVHSLSWNQEGSKLLTAGSVLQMWVSPDPGLLDDDDHGDEAGVEFFIDDNQTPANEDNMLPQWVCLWQCRPASPIQHVKFSPDGLLFATVGKCDRLVKIWYENKKVQLPLMKNDSILSPKKEEVHFSFIYISHPRAVTGFSWRKTSKFMPRGSVANMLMTSCEDNICRLWCETILPEDGLVDVHQLNPASANNPMFHTQRHKKHFIQRLHHIRNLMHKRKRNSSSVGFPGTPLPPLPSAQSIHDFHKFGVHPNSVAPGFHFHLAASINPETDIPLLPTLDANQDREHNFVVHWLNNKELNFTLEAEKILSEMTQRNSSAAGMVASDNGGCGDEQVALETEDDILTGLQPMRGMTSEPLVREALARHKRNLVKKSRSIDSERSVTSSVSSTQQSQASEQPPPHTNKNPNGVDPLDHKIEILLQNWHQGADMLFSIHPLDGSFLVWLVDWLDEPSPGCFRQSQVSFSSRIPQALPAADAATMSPSLLLYCNYGHINLKEVLKASESLTSKSYDASEKCTQASSVKYTANAMGKSSPGQTDNTLIPSVLMLSKHHNGSLNMWQISFAENSGFSTVLSIAHASRVCGHRFHTNSAACHPVLPLLLTTSHHNQPETTNTMQNADNFCSELILWRVDPVGPLSKSGGITELARINSPQLATFSSVAWLPTLLPSSTLGTFSNSPSALFVASDGSELRVYQAVIDARTLLQQNKKKKTTSLSRTSSGASASDILSPHVTSARDLFNIVSQQSTSRPGCIVQQDTIADSKQAWNQVELVHVFQEQMITGQRSAGVRGQGVASGRMAYGEALVDLEDKGVFHEHFYLIILEKLSNGDRSCLLHMWRLAIASQGVDETVKYSPDVNFVQDDEDHGSFGSTQHACDGGGGESMKDDQKLPRLSISSVKVCTQTLEMPHDVEVTCASVAAGHLSSSSIYPACFAPYLLTTACSDGRVRFWRCEVKQGQGEESNNDMKYEWSEWEMMIRTEDSCSLKVPGKPLQVSCAYNGRIAVAYRMGGVKPSSDNPDDKLVNLYVSLYECESTGGSEWTLEDTIELKNISIPDPKVNIDLSLIYDNDEGSQDTKHCGESGSELIMKSTQSTPAIVKTNPIPSLSTIHSVKKLLSVKSSRSNVLRQRHLVQLDWVSTEDGSHILTVGVGPKILLYAAVSSEISQATQSLRDEGTKSRRKTRGILQKSKSLTVQNFVEEIRWMKLRSIELGTMDGLPPLPMHMSWVRDGILVVGMDNELHVYSQWRGPGDVIDGSSANATEAGDTTDHLDTRTLTEQSLQKVASSTSLNLNPKAFKISQSMSSVKLDASISNLSLLAAGDRKDREKRKFAVSGKGDQLPSSDSMLNLQLLQDCGLFEAARLANPVLPQYHPKQLMELLNFGKIHRVKAILAHLIRCISGNDSQEGGTIISHETTQNRPRLSSHGASLARSASPMDGSSKIPDDTPRDFIEISSIPPLPLYALLAADKDTCYKSVETHSPNLATPEAPGHQDYSTLFSAGNSDEELDDPFDSNEVFGSSPKSEARKRKPSSHTPANLNYFGPSQAGHLARHLTRTQLPGLSSLDQMYLLALADTVANTRLDFSENQAPDVATKRTLTGLQGPSESLNTDSIDDCGLRYLLAARRHVYLMNTLPLGQRALMQKEGLSPAYIVWAFHSEATEELLNVLPSVQRGEPTWAELKQFGAGWWIHNVTTLRRWIEKVAKVAFQARQDPLDAALFYMALKKKTIIWGLFRSVNDSKMQQFFRNNFKEDRWRKAALKNAFALLGRQRFHHAAAFFLLAGNVRDAIEVCINKLDDIQLAIVIARLYESELDDNMPASLRRLLWEECLGYDKSGQSYDPQNAHPDPFVRSMAHWMLKDYSASLGTLLETGLGTARRTESKDSKDESLDVYSTNPSVFNFYNYLRTHPLIVRQQLAMTAVDKSQTVLLSGFTHGANTNTAGDKNVTYEDRITPIERRLYFTTAHAHFKAGCPMLALEVLSKLPAIIDMEDDITKSRSAESMCTGNSPISTGVLDKAESNTSSFDWSQPVSSAVSNGGSAFDLDWGKPISRFDSEELDVTLEDTTDTKSDSEVESKEKLLNTINEAHTSVDATSLETKQETDGRVGDIMSQQLKFIACLKIMMEELATLATGFEVDGGQLRFQLYIWLEKEVEVLRAQCNYCADKTPQKDGGKSAGDNERTYSTDQTLTSSEIETSSAKPTLHEIILAEKLDFEAKLERMTRRKEWLLSHQQLLRTLLGYSVLHGSTGGGLASVRMELILLLQELQQNKTSQKQLLSPLPFPTTLPLLSASIASAKTVIASPISHLQAQTQDILHTVIEMQSPPAGLMLSRVYTLRNLSAALSACIYQCLCDSDSFVVSFTDTTDVGMEGFTSTNVVYKDSYLMAGAQRRRQVLDSVNDDKPNSQPAKWPGVSTLRSLLDRERDEDAPKLNVLLAEALVAVYMSLFTHALATYDANILYRIVGRTFHETMWPLLFGGGVRKLVKLPSSSTADIHARVAQSKDDMSKQRLKLHMRVLGSSPGSGGQPVSPHRLKEDKPTYKEKFMPPDVSMISYFMTKPYVVPDEPAIDYDSAESLSSEEELDDDEDYTDFTRHKIKDDGLLSEHLDPNSYSWCLLRYAIIKFIRLKLLTFLPLIGIELAELPVVSPLLQALLRTLEQWEEIAKARLELYAGPPTEYIPGCYVESAINGPTILKYKALLEPCNTPFLSQHYSALPAKRLWHYLVKQADLQDIFIRYIFKKRRPTQEMDTTDLSDGMAGTGATISAPDPMKVIHKDQEVILSFCINQANLHCIAIGTQKEVIEMDISGILYPPVWLDDDVEYDIAQINEPTPNKLEAEDFLLVQTTKERTSGASVGTLTIPPTAPGVLPAPTQMAMAQTGRGGSVLKGINIPGITNPLQTYYIVDRSRRLMRRLTKRPVSVAKRMGAHPQLPYYLTGAQDGSVKLWEWGHSQHIAVARAPGSFPKVTKVLFNTQGNKFGVADGEGSLCLWQVGLGVNMSKPYLSLRCHNKTTSDFVFVGSSSLLASTGHSSDNRNVCMWDTLLPQRSSLVQAFNNHTDGATAVVFSPQHQVLITAGKRGDVSILDVRQRQLRHTFQAHDTPIKCLALDPMEEFFVTGAADGDIKVWGLTVHNLVSSFPGEHAKGSLFRNMGSGVMQVTVNPNRQLFSCGADGSLKVRQLPTRDTIVNSYTAHSINSMS